MLLVRLAAALACRHERRHVVLRRLEARSDLAMPDPVDGQVGGEHESGEAGLECLLDDLVAHATVAEDVDLEPARRAWGSLRDL